MTSNCHNLLLSSLTTYYRKNDTARKLLKDIIQSESILSLRVIDWFVTHYARTNQVIYCTLVEISQEQMIILMLIC
jgi:hypothetical protein